VGVEYRLTADAGGTRIEQIVTLTIQGWLGALAGSLAGWVLRRRMAQGLARLMAAVEAGRTGAPAG
jgi:hypothetical protein